MAAVSQKRAAGEGMLYRKDGSSIPTTKNPPHQLPILQIPDFDRPFIVLTDLSEYRLGAVLSQEFEGEEHHGLYMSTKLTPAEQNNVVDERLLP